MPFIDACREYENFVSLPSMWRLESLRLLLGQRIEVEEFKQILRVDGVSTHKYNVKKYLLDGGMDEKEVDAKVLGLSAFALVRKFEAFDEDLLTAALDKASVDMLGITSAASCFHPVFQPTLTSTKVVLEFLQTRFMDMNFEQLTRVKAALEHLSSKPAEGAEQGSDLAVRECWRKLPKVGKLKVACEERADAAWVEGDKQRFLQAMHERFTVCIAERNYREAVLLWSEMTAKGCSKEISDLVEGQLSQAEGEALEGILEVLVSVDFSSQEGIEKKRDDVDAKMQLVKECMKDETKHLLANIVDALTIFVDGYGQQTLEENDVVSFACAALVNKIELSNFKLTQMAPSCRKEALEEFVRRLLHHHDENIHHVMDKYKKIMDDISQNIPLPHEDEVGYTTWVQRLVDQYMEMTVELRKEAEPNAKQALCATIMYKAFDDCVKLSNLPDGTGCYQFELINMEIPAVQSKLMEFIEGCHFQGLDQPPASLYPDVLDRFFKGVEELLLRVAPAPYTANYHLELGRVFSKFNAFNVDKGEFKENLVDKLMNVDGIKGALQHWSSQAEAYVQDQVDALTRITLTVEGPAS